MLMRKISQFFSILFKLVLIFLIAFVWVRYFVKSLVSSIVISAIITFIVDLLSRIIFSKRNQKITLANKEKQDAEDMFFSMALETKPLSFFENIYKEKQDFSCHKEYLTFKEEDKQIALFPLFSLNEISINEIAQVVKKLKKEKVQEVIILGGTFSKESFSFIKNFDTQISLYDKYETYEKIYKKHSCFPKITKKIQENNKLSFKELLAFSFNKKRSKGYVFSALALLFCSLFVRQTLYYCIVATILLFFALFSLASPFAKYSRSQT